ncbi:hypothetical protein MIR68_010043 [Amoeboaphelidium protococcarum]|nr:hypothetical protein MIR68_010043 [Amoeboaphelidium protococcarum]
MLNVALIGCGLVGSAVFDQLLAIQESNLQSNNKSTVPAIQSRSKTRLVLVANSKSFLSLSSDQAQFIQSALSDLLDQRQADGYVLYENTVDNIVQCMSKFTDGGVIVDCTASDSFGNYYSQFLSRGWHVVTANKKGISGKWNVWSDVLLLKQGADGVSVEDGNVVRGTFKHESTVGAGLPVISTLNDLLATGDEIIKIEGVLSGTLSYVFNKFCDTTAQTLKFSEIIKDAKSNGFTEPDPRDDLNGMDVGRKVTILARLCGLKAVLPLDGDKQLESDVIQVSVASLVPESLQSPSITSAEFMDRLGAEFDSVMSEKRQGATKDGKVMRYVGTVDVKSKQVCTELKYFPSNHPLASLSGADNMIIFWTKRYGDSPLVIRGSGAGAQVTAHGVVADILKL